METKIHSGDAGYSLYENAVIQAQSRTAYHISGGTVSQGSDTSQITVAVEPGEASINDQTVSWAAEEVILPPGGDSASGPDTNDPRVDVVFAKVGPNNAGALDVAQGVAAPYAPDTKLDDSGNRVPYQPAPMEHWQPAPNDGSRVGGVVLALVLVESSDSVASDVTNQDIKNFKVGAAGTSVYIRGDGTPTGPIEMAVDNDPVTMTDTSAPDSGPFFEYDPANDEVVLGTDDAKPTLGAPLHVSNRPIQFDSSVSPFVLEDTNANAGDPSAFEIAQSEIKLDRRINAAENPLVGTGQIQPAASTGTVIDAAATSDGTRTIWTHNDGGGGDTWALYSALGGGGLSPAMGVTNQTASGPPAFAVLQDTEIVLSQGSTRVKQNGDIVIAEGQQSGGGLSNLNTLNFTEGATLNVRESDGALVYTDPNGAQTILSN